MAPYRPVGPPLCGVCGASSYATDSIDQSINQSYFQRGLSNKQLLQGPQRGRTVRR